MSRSSLRVTCLLPALFVIAPALGQGTPRSIGECERLKNDLAYNQCLAMFGPAAKNVAGGDGSAGAAPAPSYSEEAIAAAGIPSAEEPELDEGYRHGRRGRYGRRSGRQSVSFALAGTDESASAMPKSGSRSRRYRRRH